MKNFTLIASALLVAAVADAAPAVSHTSRSKTIFGNSSAETQSVAKPQKKTLLDYNYMEQRGKKSALRKAPGARVAAPGGTIITETPAGTLTDWSRSGTGWWSFFGYIIATEINGYVQHMVDAGDDTVYLDLLMSQYPLDTWVKAEKGADGSLTVAAGQVVYQEYYDGEKVDFCMVPMSYDYNEDDELYFTYYDEIKFNLEDGKYRQDNPELIFGLCEWDPTEQEYYWTGYGDSEVELSAVPGKPLTAMPEGVSSERWAAMTTDDGYFVKVGADADNVYVKGLQNTCPDAVAVGKISADGKTVTFSGGQFMGESDDWTWAYIYGGKMDEVWDDYYEDYVTMPVPTGDLTFAYDAEHRRLTMENTFIVCSNTGDDLADVLPASYIEELTVEYQERNPEALPSAPFELEFVDEFAAYESNSLYFKIPVTDVDGNLLETANLYYRLYVDGDPFVFYADEYRGCPEDGTELINVAFSNYYDIYCAGVDKCVYLYFEGADELGVQSVYLQPVEGGEPVELCSEVVTVSTDPGASVADAMAGKEVKASVYYDLQGRRIASPAPGLYIRRDVMSDGSVRTAKVAVK